MVKCNFYIRHCNSIKQYSFLMKSNEEKDNLLNMLLSKDKIIREMGIELMLSNKQWTNTTKRAIRKEFKYTKFELDTKRILPPSAYKVRRVYCSDSQYFLVNCIIYPDYFFN